MKKLLKLALVVGAAAAVAKLVTAKKSQWYDLTESQVREKLDSKLPGRMPEAKRTAVADQVVSRMRDRGVLREQAEATSRAPAEQGGTAADTTAGSDSEDSTELAAVPAPGPPEGLVPADETLSSEEIATIAEEAYVFSFPMLMGYRYCFATFLAPELPSYRGPANGIYGEAATLDHTFKDVITPNADTPYSMAMLDLRAEPVVLEVPEVTDRYYVMQFEDLFGTNVHYVGSRATGSGAGTYLAVGPRWEGETPEGFDAVLAFETDLVFLIGRTQLLGPDDVADLATVMKGYHLRPLSQHLGLETPAAAAFDWPVWNDEASRDERFIEFVNSLLRLAQPTHPSELELMTRFSSIGIGPGVAFAADQLDTEVRTAIRAGITSARTAMAEAAENLGEKINGWSATDAFGNRAWYGGDYLLRAAGAMGGWGGNDKIEAYYPLTREDSKGRPLDGAHRYRLRLKSAPPARAFWSVTMYDTSYDGTAGYLVKNPIGRYLINSTTQRLSIADDGSLTIVIQRDRPDTPEEQANWLPAPTGPFYLTMRIYWPEEAALDGTWTPPPVKRVKNPSE